MDGRGHGGRDVGLDFVLGVILIEVRLLGRGDSSRCHYSEHLWFVCWICWINWLEGGLQGRALCVEMAAATLIGRAESLPSQGRCT